MFLEISKNSQKTPVPESLFLLKKKSLFSLLKKDSDTDAFTDTASFVKFLRTPFLKNTSGQMLLQT